jgi:hypothetical protein
MIHVWQRCHHCGAAPIEGVRFECATCPAGPDSHLCEACHEAVLEGRCVHPPPGALGASRGGNHVFTPVAGASPARAEPWLRTPDVARAHLDIPDRCVVRPEFLCRTTAHVGSYAAVVDGGDAGPLVLTALHVLDALWRDLSAAGELEGGGAALALAKAIERITVYDVFARRWMGAALGTVGPMLALPLARLGEEEPYCQSDLAAFAADGGPGYTRAPLAATCPVAGDRLWLAVAMTDGRRSAQAVVVERSERTLVFRFAAGEERSLPQFTSGAPLFDSGGRVAGIHVGSGTFAGRRYGHAVHVDSIRGHLRTAADEPRHAPTDHHGG